MHGIIFDNTDSQTRHEPVFRTLLGSVRMYNAGVRNWSLGERLTHCKSEKIRKKQYTSRFGASETETPHGTIL